MTKKEALEQIETLQEKLRKVNKEIKEKELHPRKYKSELDKLYSKKERIKNAIKKLRPLLPTIKSSRTFYGIPKQVYSLKNVVRQTIDNASVITHCQHCGKEIINIAYLKGDTDKKEYEVGLDCVKKLLANSSKFEMLPDDVRKFEQQIDLYNKAFNRLNWFKKNEKKYKDVHYYKMWNDNGTFRIAWYYNKDKLDGISESFKPKYEPIFDSLTPMESEEPIKETKEEKKDTRNEYQAIYNVYDKIIKFLDEHKDELKDRDIHTKVWNAYKALSFVIENNHLGYKVYNKNWNNFTKIDWSDIQKYKKFFNKLISQYVEKE